MGGQLPRGVSVRNGRLWISFQFKGLRCRESLKIEPTLPNIRYAETKLKKIHLEIELNEFDYTRHFPKSKNLKKLGLEHKVSEFETVKERLHDFMGRHEKDRVSYSTYKGYMKSVEGTLIPEFGDCLVRELTPSQIAAWAKRCARNLTRKTVANHLLPLRNMYAEIETNEGHPNPVKKVNLSLYFTRKQKAQVETASIDPFSEDEIQTLLKETTGQTRNLIQLWAFTGLRSGEIVCLRWNRVDFERKKLTINCSVVDDIESSTKTGETRIIDLLPPALSALRAQYQLTKNNEFVFVDRKYDTRYKGDQAIRKKAWRPVFNNSKIRYRYPYQLRHSFAIMMLMAGEDERWVAQMLGHRSLEMLRRHYAKFLPNKQAPEQYETRNDWSGRARFGHVLKVVK